MEDTKSKDGVIGPIIGAIIIVLLLLVGSYYFLSQRISKLEEQKRQTAEINLLNNSTSTEIENI